MYILHQENNDHKRTMFDLRCAIKRSRSEAEKEQLRNKIKRIKECVSFNNQYLNHKL